MSMYISKLSPIVLDAKMVGMSDDISSPNKSSAILENWIDIQMLLIMPFA